MDAPFIYTVGKPYPYPEALAALKKLGYRAGLFLDRSLTSVNTSAYDHVVPIDFSNAQHLTDGLDKHSLAVAGLTCTYENYVPAKAVLGAYFGVPASSLQSAEQCTDKYLMRQAFMEADRSITPNFVHVDSPEHLLRAVQGLQYPLIIKPTNLVKSLLVLRCDNQDELIKNFEYAHAHVQELYERYHVYGRPARLIVEEYIVGKLCSVAAFVDHTGEPHFCDGIAALTNAQDRGISDNYLYGRQLPGSFNDQLARELINVARKGVYALDMRSTPAHVELIYNDEGVKLIEIGARIGGYRPRMYAYSYGLDLITQEIKLALGQQPDLSGTFQEYCGVYELFPEAEGAFAGVEGAHDVGLYTSYKVKAKPGQHVGPAKNGYKASAIIIVTAKEQATFNQICRSIDSMRIMTT